MNYTHHIIGISWQTFYEHRRRPFVTHDRLTRNIACVLNMYQLLKWDHVQYILDNINKCSLYFVLYDYPSTIEVTLHNMIKCKFD